MAGEVLGRRVDHEVGAELERALQQRRREGRVDGEPGAALVGCGGERREVGDPDQRVVRRFGPDQVGVADRLDRRLGVGLVDVRDLERAIASRSASSVRTPW